MTLKSTCLLTVILAARLAAQTPVWTAQYNNSRTNATLNETILNKTNVNQASFGKLFTWKVDGVVSAQPLYIPHLTINGKTRNVVYIATANNSIYAYDADDLTATPLWTKNFGPPLPPSAANGTCPGTSSPMGILSTPVVDVTTNTIYFVTTTPTVPANGSAHVFYMNAVDLVTSQHKFGSPRLIQMSVTGTGYDNVGGVITLDTIRANQRPGLLMSGGNVYAAFAVCGVDIDPWHGWMIGFKTSWLGAHTNPWNSTPNGGQGGIWQSNMGLTADAANNIYLSTGNGTVGKQGFGLNVMKLSQWGGVLDWYTPSGWAQLNQYDLDLSSSGVLEIPGANRLIAGGKEGVLYVLDENNLKAPLQKFQGTAPCAPIGARTCHQVHSVAYWGTSTKGTYYLWGGNDVLRAFPFQDGVLTTTPSSTNSIATDYTGGNLAISANGTDPATGILWATDGAIGNVNLLKGLYAFDASDVSKLLYSTQQNPTRDALTSVAKWGTPTVANGRVYVPTFGYVVTVYGLLP